MITELSKLLWALVEKVERPHKNSDIPFRGGLRQTALAREAGIDGGKLSKAMNPKTEKDTLCKEEIERLCRVEQLAVTAEERIRLLGAVAVAQREKLTNGAIESTFVQIENDLDHSRNLNFELSQATEAVRIAKRDLRQLRSISPLMTDRLHIKYSTKLEGQLRVIRVFGRINTLPEHKLIRFTTSDMQWLKEHCGIFTSGDRETYDLVESVFEAMILKVSGKKDDATKQALQRSIAQCQTPYLWAHSHRDQLIISAARGNVTEYVDTKNQALDALNNRNATATSKGIILNGLALSSLYISTVTSNAKYRDEGQKYLEQAESFKDELFANGTRFYLHAKLVSLARSHDAQPEDVIEAIDQLYKYAQNGRYLRAYQYILSETLNHPSRMVREHTKTLERVRLSPVA